MKIEIEIETAVAGKFSAVKLCYQNTSGENKKVDLYIDFQPLHDFCHDTKSLRFDFFLFSAIVYGVDNLINRKMYSLDGWTRELEVIFPVKHLTSWQGHEETIEDVLSFLTGDDWTISFRQLENKVLFKEKNRRWTKYIPSFRKSDIEAVSLFSGGLDSLLGVIEQLEQLNDSKKILFVSHFDSNSRGPNSDQRTLLKYLDAQYQNKIYWVQSTITISRKDNDGLKVRVENSYRSRSLLFIGVALLLFTSHVPTSELIIPENGTISLNHPLTKSRMSSLSTRTTHPFVIKHLETLLKNLGIITKLSNPYAFKTKGEMVKECGNPKVLQGIYKESVSCGKRGHNSSWDEENRGKTHHCGMCMPCIYRRAALHQKKWDSQIYGVDILNISVVSRGNDFPALFDYLNTPLSKETIKRNLVVYGSLPLENLDNYAEVVIRSRKEILSWLKHKGNACVKKLAGIK